jgi:hypothetical protein
MACISATPCGWFTAQLRTGISARARPAVGAALAGYAACLALLGYVDLVALAVVAGHAALARYGRRAPAGGSGLSWLLHRAQKSVHGCHAHTYRAGMKYNYG